MNININVKETNIPEGIIDIVSQLPDINQLEGDTTITLIFSDKFVFRTGLVLLSTWRKTLPKHVKVIIDDHRCPENTKRVLINSGFRDLIEKNDENPSNTHYIPGKVPLQPIVHGFSTENAISKMVNIFDEYANDWIEMQAFRVLLSELCENSFAHSEFETPGYFAADLHKSSGFCEIAIADSGIGILNSYREGTNEEAKKRISNGASALDLAIDGLSSSKPVPLPGTLRSYYGYGLFIVRRLMEENAGRLTIVSGSDCLTIEKHQKNRLGLKKPWRGTFIGLLINTANPLPLQEVYDEGVSLLVPENILKNKKETIISERTSDITTKQLILANYGTLLLTREVGIAIRADLATMLAGETRVEIVLDKVEDLTPSVADEVFGKIAESMGVINY